MAEKLNTEELVSHKELSMANSMQIDALCQLLLEKGLITHDEFFDKLKEVKANYNARIQNSDSENSSV